MNTNKQTTTKFVETKTYTIQENIELDSNIKFGPIDVAYETYGTLNEAKDNAILVCHALTGDAHAAGFHSADDRKPGWWDDMIGAGKAFDTDKYFVVCSNCLGGCVGTTGPSSIDPLTKKPYGINFPVVTIGDMVRVQKQLIEHLGIEKLLAVAGGSMGGMQALEWAMRYPDSLQASIVIASTTRISPQAIAFDAVGRNAIISDPNYNNGDYYNGELPARGLSIARMIGHITYLSDESMHAKFGRRLQEDEGLHFDFSNEFQVESYLDYQGNKFVERFDANSYLYVTRAIDYFDLAAYYGNGNLVKALERIKSKLLIMSFSSDWLFPQYQSQEMVDALIEAKKQVTYLNIESSYGHDAFLLEYETETRLIENFLSALYAKKGCCNV